MPKLPRPDAPGVEQQPLGTPYSSAATGARNVLEIGRTASRALAIGANVLAEEVLVEKQRVKSTKFLESSNAITSQAGTLMSDLGQFKTDDVPENANRIRDEFEQFYLAQRSDAAFDERDLAEWDVKIGDPAKAKFHLDVLRYERQEGLQRSVDSFDAYLISGTRAIVASGADLDALVKTAAEYKDRAFDLGAAIYTDELLEKRIGAWISESVKLSIGSMISSGNSREAKQLFEAVKGSDEIELLDLDVAAIEKVIGPANDYDLAIEKIAPHLKSGDYDGAHEAAEALAMSGEGEAAAIARREIDHQEGRDEKEADDRSDEAYSKLYHQMVRGEITLDEARKTDEWQNVIREDDLDKLTRLDAVLRGERAKVMDYDAFASLYRNWYTRDDGKGGRRLATDQEMADYNVDKLAPDVTAEVLGQVMKWQLSARQRLASGAADSSTIPSMLRLLEDRLAYYEDQTDIEVDDSLRGQARYEATLRAQMEFDGHPTAEQQVKIINDALEPWMRTEGKNKKFAMAQAGRMSEEDRASAVIAYEDVPELDRQMLTIYLQERGKRVTAGEIGKQYGSYKTGGNPPYVRWLENKAEIAAKKRERTELAIVEIQNEVIAAMNHRGIPITQANFERALAIAEAHEATEAELEVRLGQSDPEDESI